MTAPYRDQMFGSYASADGLLLFDVPKDNRALESRKILLCPADGLVPVGLRLNGEECALPEPWRDEEGQPIQGSFDAHNVFPLLQGGDRIELSVKWHGPGAAPASPMGMLSGRSWEEASDVQSYEVSLDSGRTIAVNESLEMRQSIVCGPCLDRLWVAGGQTQADRFVIEEMSVSRSGGPSADKWEACVRVRCVDPDGMPRRFRGKMIGTALRQESVG